MLSWIQTAVALSHAQMYPAEQGLSGWFDALEEPGLQAAPAMASTGALVDRVVELPEDDPWPDEEPSPTHPLVGSKQSEPGHSHSGVAGGPSPGPGSQIAPFSPVAHVYWAKGGLAEQ